VSAAEQQANEACNWLHGNPPLLDFFKRAALNTIEWLRALD
jgi:hypothetical protein